MKQFFQLISQKFAQVIALIVVALILGIGVSVFATNYIDPTCTPPGCNAPVPVNITNIMQEKGDLTSPINSDLLKVGGSLTANRLNSVSGSLLAGITTIGLGVGTESFTSKVPSLFTKPVTVNNTLTADVSTQNPSGGGARNALFLKAAANEEANFIVHSTPAVGFWSTATNKLGDLIANSIQLASGAGAGKVLTSDVDGKATWQPAGAPTTLTKVSVDAALKGTTGTLNKVLTADANGVTIWRYPGTVAASAPNLQVAQSFIRNNVSSGTVQRNYRIVMCPADYMAVSGGGQCEDGKSSDNYMTASEPLYKTGFTIGDGIDANAVNGAENQDAFANIYMTFNGSSINNGTANNQSGFVGTPSPFNGAGYTLGTNYNVGYGYSARIPVGWGVRCSEDAATTDAVGADAVTGNIDITSTVVCQKISGN